MKVFTYVIVNDHGSAPNYDKPLVTLAVCKPRIRQGAVAGDLVLAFTGSALGPEPHAVRWAGIVVEKMTFSEYWRDQRFQCKKPKQSLTPDNIYRPGRSGLVQVRNSTHGANSAPRDLGGGYVLAFDRAWYFGEATALLPASFGLRMAMSSRRGHRVVKLPPAQARRLIRWLDKEAPSLKRTATKPARRRACGSARRSC